jgi:integrase
MPTRPTAQPAPRSTPLLTKPGTLSSNDEGRTSVTRTHRPRHGRPLAIAARDDLVWSSAKVPTLTSLEPLANRLPHALRHHICSSAVPETDLERADCRGIPGWLLDVAHGQASVSRHQALFDSQVLPASQASRTRDAYFALWRSFVSYAFIHGALHEVLPSSSRLLKGYMWFLLQAGYRPGSLTLHIYAIIDRHRRFNHPFPHRECNVKAWIKAFERLCGVPRRDHAVVTATHLKAILSAPRTSLRHLRDTLIVAVGTVCALRVSELIELDVCDVLFDFEPNVLAMRVKKRKNVQKRAGLWPRIGVAVDPRFDIIALLREWLLRTGRRITAGCEKALYPRSSCHACGRLFSRLNNAGSLAYPVGHAFHAATHNTIRDAVRSSLSNTGFPTSDFSGISMRRGGLTTALTGGVPSDLYELQSGHASDQWKKYVHPGQEHKLLMFYRSFEM